jgi:hypothetical protein
MKWEDVQRIVTRALRFDVLDRSNRLQISGQLKESKGEGATAARAC